MNGQLKEMSVKKGRQLGQRESKVATNTLNLKICICNITNDNRCLRASSHIFIS